MWKPDRSIDDNQFLIKEVLGSGGFGVVYLAIEQNTGKEVVIKTLNQSRQNKDNFDKEQIKFVREAFRLQKCNHPHIVKIFDVIQHDGLWGIVMERIDGDDLSVHIQDGKVFAESVALKYIDQIGQALEYIHQQGLLHRDIKPNNIIIRRYTDEAILIDFGLAREYTTNGELSMTNARTQGYAPIEQYERNGNFGPHTDVYALSATLYSLLTGEIPLPANFRKTGIEILSPQAHGQRNPAIIVSDKINTAILKGMALQAKDRVQNIKEFRDLLGSAKQAQTTSEKSYNAYQYFERGKQLYESKNFNTALHEIDSAIELKPDEVMFYYYRGSLHTKLKQYQEAIKDYSKAIKVEPKNAVLWQKRGDLYRKNKKYQDAFRDYDEVAKLVANSSTYLMHETLFRRVEHTELSQIPTDKIYNYKYVREYRLSIVAYIKGNYKEAKAHRKHDFYMLNPEEWINCQRHTIYSERRRIIENKNIREQIVKYINQLIDDLVNAYVDLELPAQNNIEDLVSKLQDFFGPLDDLTPTRLENMPTEKITSFLQRRVLRAYDLKEAQVEQVQSGLMREAEHFFTVQQINALWCEYLQLMSDLMNRGADDFDLHISVKEYSEKADKMFLDLMTNISRNTVYSMFQFSPSNYTSQTS